jgi:hypothetical protein
MGVSTADMYAFLEANSCDKLASLSTYFKLASHFPEPCASLLTLTVTMRAVLLSDDRSTRAVLKDLFPYTSIISTLTLLYLSIIESSDGLDGLSIIYQVRKIFLYTSSP